VNDLCTVHDFLMHHNFCPPSHIFISAKIKTTQFFTQWDSCWISCHNNNLFKSSSSRITQQIWTQVITTQSEPDMYKTKPVLDLEEEEQEERKGKTVIYFSRSRTNRWVFEKSKVIFLISAKKDVGKCLQFKKKRKLNFPARWRRPVGPATTVPAF
jgi:uncharacterized protein (DUF3084 family)